MEIHSSENIILSISVATSVLIWGWTFWKNRNEPSNEAPRKSSHRRIKETLVRSPASPRTQSAFETCECTCKMVSITDDCRQNKEKNTWNGSDEEEIDTDTNLIPSSMRSSRRVMLNR